MLSRAAVAPLSERLWTILDASALINAAAMALPIPFADPDPNTVWPVSWFMPGQNSSLGHLQL